MRRQFRFATKRPSGPSRLLAKRSPGCKHEGCCFARNAVVMSLASGSDELHLSGLVLVVVPLFLARRSPDGD
jgi:hypothetical protein